MIFEKSYLNTNSLRVKTVDSTRSLPTFVSTYFSEFGFFHPRETVLFLSSKIDFIVFSLVIISLINILIIFVNDIVNFE